MNLDAYLAKRGGNKVFMRTDVISNSMYPLIKAGDTIICEPCKSVKVGDVALFKADEIIEINGKKAGYIVHRVIGVKKRGMNKKSLFLEKGDAIYSYYGIKDESFGKVIVIEKNKKIIYLDKNLWKTYSFLTTTISKFEHLLYRSIQGPISKLSDNKRNILLNLIFRPIRKIKSIQYNLLLLLDN